MNEERNIYILEIRVSSKRNIMGLMKNILNILMELLDTASFEIESAGVAVEPKIKRGE